jgi:hypothetical protein
LAYVVLRKTLLSHSAGVFRGTLNLVERFFGLITEKQIRRGVFSSVSDLEKKIMQFIEVHNENPEPFVWTKPVDEIMAKINRARLALSNV